MKRTLNTLAAIAIVGSAVVSSSAYAQEEMMPKMDGGTGISAPAPKDESAYWAEKKLEMQRKSTEMRKQKVEELRTKGLDTSSITEDLLDGTKTEEKLFWDAIKKIMQNKDSANRQKVVEELRKAGLDTSSLTSEALDPTVTDEGKFWNLVKAIKETKADKKYQSTEGKESIRTPNVKPKKEEMKHDMKHEKKPETGGDVKNETGKSDMQKPAQKPVLTEKMRQALVKRFNAVPEEKKAAYYEKTKTNLEKQLENAKSKKNTRLARKITETLAILEYAMGSSIGDAEEDEIINSATAE